MKTRRLESAVAWGVLAGGLAVVAAASSALAADPCCSIKRIDVKGVPCCTAQVTATGQTFQFNVPRAVAARLRVGQAVALDARGQRVTIPGLGSFDTRGPLPTGPSTPPEFGTRFDDFKNLKNAECAAGGRKHVPPRECHAEVTVVSTGSSPGEEDDTYSFTCVCK
jgi:hypothetical protein